MTCPVRSEAQPRQFTRQGGYAGGQVSSSHVLRVACETESRYPVVYRCRTMLWQVDATMPCHVFLVNSTSQQMLGHKKLTVKMDSSAFLY